MYVMSGCPSPTQNRIQTRGVVQHLASLRAGALAAALIVVDRILPALANFALDLQRQSFGISGQRDQMFQFVSHDRQCAAPRTSTVIPQIGERR